MFDFLNFIIDILSQPARDKSDTEIIFLILADRSPLEQFEVRSRICILSFFLPNGLSIVGVIVLCLRTAGLLMYQRGKKNFITHALEAIYELIAAVVRQNLYIRKQQYFTVTLYLFTTIFISNLMGLLPFGFTLTSSFAFTFFLALSHFVGVNFIGVTRHGWHLTHLLLPEGVPFVIRPVLVLIERVSYAARLVSLGVRLFANRLAGHALLKILISFALLRVSSTSIVSNMVAVIPWSIVGVILILEFVIAFLQAYVFTLLVTVYLNDTLVLH